jgi:polysaccharide chain length determinant protein (PEP-CTERM system associated)
MFDFRNLVAPYAAALWQQRRVAMAIAWVICLLGWFVVASLPSSYTSNARLLVDTDKLLSPLMQGLAVAPDFDHQVEIMRKTLLSLPNIEELIERTDLDNGLQDPAARAGLIESLAKNLRLTVLGKNLFEISYNSGDPDLAFEAVSGMLDIFIEQQLGHSQRDVEIAGAFIDEQITAYDEKLRAAELRLAEFQREHAEELGGAARNVRDLEQTEAEMRRLRSELEAAEWRRDQLKAKLDSTPKTISSAQAGSAEASPAQQQLRELNRELTRKLLLYTEQHPDILALRQLIAQANEQVKDESEGNQIADITVPNPLFEQLNSQLGVIEVSIDDLGRRLAIAENESQALGGKIRQAPEVEADLKRLNRDYDVLLVRYEELTQRRESAQLARELDEGKNRIEFRTINPPVRPLKPSGPPHGLFMLAILVIGVGTGCGFVIGRFIISGTVLTSAQLQAVFPSLPILGGVSEVPARGRMPGYLGVASSAAALLMLFVVFFYFYQISPVKPDLMQLAADLTARITETIVPKYAKAEP